MRSLDEASKLWQTTVQSSTNLANLKLHVRPGAAINPCLSGLRSVCWKTFLLFRNTDLSTWSTTLSDSRDAYTALRDHLLKYIEHPNELGSGLDPLDDDQNSPWNTLRRDEELRAEIFQDVERCMPDEPYFRQPDTQRMLLDILFIFCKLNQDVGYRQGMHELLAPVLWVVERDAIDNAAIEATSASFDESSLMIKVLDSRFIVHDAFTLFALVMQTGKSFYELGEPEKRSSVQSALGSEQKGSAPIVARSRQIHEVFLAQVDPELASHLTEIEILPQIFLIRWIRLLFGREFPFEDLLALWDTLFAEDPALDLVDLICVAMLLRIRWQLIDADYSAALSSLLKYPYLGDENGPQTFVEDAVYLRDHLDIAGGNHIITKYSGKTPAPSKEIPPRRSALSPERNPFLRRSPMPSPASFLKQQGGVEALLQGAAKGMLERGEKLGINRAVRDAVVEVRKSMQGLAAPSGSAARSSDASRWSLDDGRSIPSSRKTIAAFETRNRQLGIMLDEALKGLREASKTELAANSPKSNAVDIAIAKIQFVQVYLSDSSMPLPSQEQDKSTALRISPMSATSQTPPKSASPAPSTSSQSYMKKPAGNTPSTTDKPTLPKETEESNPLENDDTPTLHKPIQARPAASYTPNRPHAPVPTRSSLAQSSFAWMLESEGAQASSSNQVSSRASSTFAKSGRRPTSSTSREKAAFLFGDDPDDDDKESNERKASVSTTTDPDEGFSLGAMKGPSAR